MRSDDQQFLQDRLSIRLNLKPELLEEVFSMISDIDAVKNSWRITGKLLPQTMERLTHSVIVTSTGASNRIEGNNGWACWSRIRTFRHGHRRHG
jgi:hypothetical protein